MYKQINIDKLSDYKSSSKWWGFLYNASESLQSMIIKTQFHHGPRPPPSASWMQHQTYKNESAFRNNAFTSKFCWDIFLHVHEKSENKVERDKTNLSILISPSFSN